MIGVVVLAAGQGVRMNSKLPKVLHRLAGKQMITYVLEAVQSIDAKEVVVVLGRGGGQVRQTLGDTLTFVEQNEPLGTGHAVWQAQSRLQGRVETVLVLYGDTPLIRGATLQHLSDTHTQSRACITMLTGMVDDPIGYGRIVRSADGRMMAIVEEEAANSEQKLIKEVNGGVYCFTADWLWQNLSLLPISRKGEYYLTDLVSIAVGQRQLVETCPVTDLAELKGINNRVQLAEAEEELRWRVRRDLMLSGVTLIQPSSIFIDADVQIGRDTIIYPNTFLEGKTRIGEDCLIGPNSHVIDSSIGDRCRIVASMLEEVSVAEGVNIGPFSHLRLGAHLAADVFVGNFAEIKKSRLGRATQVHHFSYLGDAIIGERANIGAGTVTCNYDSETKRKSSTVIEDDAAIGSDTLLVAPVRVGAGAVTGSGAVVTKDVPPGHLVVGVPARVKRKVKNI
ncbi:MAG: bifunctional UDP-N-acetylglucosamine diphosphorylase/glucosamine-1-phosphate N-acetyltransferase GlmU [Chloroflexi bacterium]|nr:bifunctional UDP-N-acetylglucosamine diphosphorylase/glucosamine-1-phosphate N-acetyltransferase GlmU [Chloroflexota bacterium]MCL5074920.1 bifunctional UDP-N-acetylglucosamine diphosphorylase/glucosamine-1-phosphate N-acetyltransferase GlmU [Chloroflexota bacterium]